MSKPQDNSLLETVPHNTEHRPFSIHYTKVQSESDQALYLHWHSELEFFYLEKGEVLFFIEEQEYHLKAGEALFIPAHLLHSAKRISEEDCSHYAFVFSPSYLFEPAFDSRYLHFIDFCNNAGINNLVHIVRNSSCEAVILDNLQAIYACYNLLLENCELSIRGHLLVIWQELYNHYFIHNNNKSNIKLYRQMQSALLYINEHYNDALTLTQLAQLVHLSDEQFCRLFKKLNGFSPFTYLNRYRIQRSCEHLINTDKKIADIATLCGYNNISYYNREFNKFMKMTPGSYRKYMQY